MIRTNYDLDADVLHVTFGPEDVRSDTSEEVAPGVYVAFDPTDNPIGVEITSARRRGTRHGSVRTAADRARPPA